MTFRPSDDVIEQQKMDSLSADWNSQNYAIYGNSNQTSSIFLSNDENWNFQNNESFGENQAILNLVWEEQKAPNLQTLLDNNPVVESKNNQNFDIVDNVSVDSVSNIQNSWLVDNNAVENSSLNNISTDLPVEEQLQENSVMVQESNNTIQQNGEISQNQILEQNVVLQENIIASDWKLGIIWDPNEVIYDQDETYVEQVNLDDLDLWDSFLKDEDRAQIVSSVEWAIHSKLDFFVDYKWLDYVNKYKRLNRLVFRWGIHFIIILLGIVFWSYLQINAWEVSQIKTIDSENIWVNESDTKKIALDIEEKYQNIDVIIPYWALRTDNNKIFSYSNLISYSWIILPKNTIYDFSEDLSVIDNFEKGIAKKDYLMKLMNKILEKPKKIEKKPAFSAKKLEDWLINWFNLSCLNSYKISDLICSKLIDSFLKYWMNYDLVNHDEELEKTVDLIVQNWDYKSPICNMIINYTQSSWETSDKLEEIVEENCTDDEINYYKTLINFIEVNKSLNSRLTDNIYINKDINAYKIISAMQALHSSNTLNVSEILYYLEYVQSLIDKESSNLETQLLPNLYKDFIYLFNNEELKNLVQSADSSKISKEELKDILIKISLINNWNSREWHKALKNFITSSDLLSGTNATIDTEISEKSMLEIFDNFNEKLDRLRIKDRSMSSSDEILSHVEIFSDTIHSINGWESLKAVIYFRKDKSKNLLYVNKIKISSYSELTEIVNSYVKSKSVTMNDMLEYIDEQIPLFNNRDSEKEYLCDTLKENSTYEIFECTEDLIEIYKWDIRYLFVLQWWSLQSFEVWDVELDKEIHEKLNWKIIYKDNTNTIITDILNYEKLEEPLEWKNDKIVENELEVLNHFKIYLANVPDIAEIDWKDDEFIVSFNLWDIRIKALYNVETHELSDVSYVICNWNDTLLIKDLKIQLTTENKNQLSSIINNPVAFLKQANEKAYKKFDYYQIYWCEDSTTAAKK